MVIWQFSFPDEDNSPILQVRSFSLLIACMYLFVCCICKHHGTHVDVRGLFRDHFSPCGPGGLNSESQVWQQPLSHLTSLAPTLICPYSHDSPVRDCSCLNAALSLHCSWFMVLSPSQHLISRHSEGLQFQPTRKGVILGAWLAPSSPLV